MTPRPAKGNETMNKAILGHEKSVAITTSGGVRAFGKRASGPSLRSTIDGLAIAFFTVAIVVIGASFLEGCALFGGQNSCKAINLAAQACPAVVDFIGADGGTQRVSLSREDAIEVKANHDRTAALRAADAGQ